MTTIEQSFSARQVPWAKIGTQIDDPDVDALEAARLGGIDFDVEVTPAGYFVANERVTDDVGEPMLLDDDTPMYLDADGEVTSSPGEWRAESTRRSIVRQDTKDWFSFVSNEYEPVQYREAFAFMDQINPRYVAAGSMSHGRQGFMVVQLLDHMQVDVDVNGEVDEHGLYVVLQTSHDLSRGIKISVTMLRNRCMNMLVLPSFDPGAPQNWSIRHVGDPRAKLEEANHVITNAANYRESFERTVVQLASVAIDSDDLRQIARRALPARLKTRDTQVEAIVDRFETAATVGFNGTGWGAVQAMSDFLQWGRNSATRTDQSEFTSPLDGDTAKYVNRAVQLVMTRG